MKTIAKPLLLLVALFWLSSAYASTYRTYQQHLDRILKEYIALPQSRDVRRLVELDRELAALAEQIQKNDRSGESAKIWRKDYESIGVYVGHYSDQIGYSGKLLVEAHAINPNSPYREYTLFTTLLGEGTFHGLGEMPNIEAARKYIQEFPRGPFAAKTYAIIGSFYDDLAKVIKEQIEDAENNKDYKYDCFSKYLTKEPYKAQLEKARSYAIENLEKAIALTEDGEHKDALRQELMDVKKGESNGWYWCAD
jgi:hypothetical protein